jgi:hypothetical protein
VPHQSIGLNKHTLWLCTKRRASPERRNHSAHQKSHLASKDYLLPYAVQHGLRQGDPIAKERFATNTHLTGWDVVKPRINGQKEVAKMSRHCGSGNLLHRVRILNRKDT